MLRNHTLAAALICLLALPAVAGAQTEDALPPVGTEHAEPPPVGREQVEKIAREAGRKVSGFAAYSDAFFERATRSATFGWVLVVGALLVGALAAFFGWTLVKTLLVPCAPVLGLATGGVIAFSIAQGFYTDTPPWFRLALFVVGGALGVGAYLFSALKARPVAAFLVILSPFLMLSAFLFPYSAVTGLVVFCVGFLAGFAAMVEVRPLSIVTTSMFGACAFLAALGLLSHLLGGETAAIGAFWRWLIGRPLMLAVGWGALAFIGTSFQFATAPRGTLEG